MSGTNIVIIDQTKEIDTRPTQQRGSGLESTSHSTPTKILERHQRKRQQCAIDRRLAGQFLAGVLGEVASARRRRLSHG